MLTLAFLATGCGPEPTPIEASGVAAFEQSRIAAKRSLSESDRTQLQNAIFALATARYPGGGNNPYLKVTTPEWEFGTVSGTILRRSSSGQVDADRAGFVRNFGERATERNPKDIIRAALDEKFDLVDPVTGVVQAVIATKQAELEQKSEHVIDIFTSVLADAKDNDKGRIKFSIKNETKGTIVAIDAMADVGYVSRETNRTALMPIHFDLGAGLAPGDTSQDFVVVASDYNPDAPWIKVYLADGTSFLSISPDDLPAVTEELDAVRTEKIEMTAGFRQITDWLQSLH